jgi:tetratricopeptide (TPR) repeat protein
MGFVAEAIWLIKIRRYQEAAKLLERHLSDADLKQSAKSGLMSWIGECYLKAEDRRNAGRWFEQASKAASESQDLEAGEKQSRILKELEEAMECYKSEDDISGIARIASLRDSLIKSPLSQESEPKTAAS